MIASLILALAVQAYDPDPLAKARAGWLQCHQPNEQAKTCEALAAYIFAADGSIRNDATLNYGGGLTARTSAPVTVREGYVCGYVENLDQAVFARDGAPLDAATTADMRRQMAISVRPILGVEFCTRYIRDGNGFTTETLADGERMPGASRVIWVSPDSGWRVGR